jgi:DNA invertase Pin-like site-specific DNA recombinase
VNRYFIYCRKSSEDQDHQILSIESQRLELNKYAKRENLTIVAIKEEAKSAKSPGRPVFNDMLKRITRGEADGILAWHPDRLARNALDGGQVIHLLDIGKLIDMRFPTYTFENTSQGKFMLAIIFGQSKYYVDSLSENIRRGNRTKREKGWLPCCAPIGYLNSRSETGEKNIVADQDRFSLIKRLWELFLSGGHSIPQLREIAEHRLGLRTPKRRRRGGSPLCASGLYRVFSNPFYAGQIAHESQWYPGKHEAMISVAQFERAQTLLGRPNRARPKTHKFAYTGLVRCGNCQASVTAEEKVNRYGSRYVYYRCTHNKRHIVCREKAISEVQLETQIIEFLGRISLSGEEVDRVMSVLEDERKKEWAAGGGIKESLERALETSLRNSDNLTKMRYREMIDDQEFTRQRSALMQEQTKLNQQLQQLNTERWVEPSKKLVLFSNRAIFWLTHGSIDEKRLILAAVGSNLTLIGRKLNVCAREPFVTLTESRENSDWCSLVHDVRTFFTTQPDFEIPLLPEPNTEVRLAA